MSVCFMILIVSFSFSLKLLFTFYFSFQNCFLLFTFYFLELLYFFSFTYVLFIVSTRTSIPPHLPPFVSEALFCLCCGTNIYNSSGGASEFQDTYHGFLYFLTFLIFLSGFFILLVREKQRKTLYRFLLAKIKGWDRNNRDKNSEHNNNNTNKWKTK